MRLLGFLSTGSSALRVINLVGVAVLLAIAVGGYAFKTTAAAEDARAAAIDAGILREQKRIRMLRAEISKLGEPLRIAELSRTYLGMAPPDPRREITPQDLARIAAPQPPGTTNPERRP
jgi:hypothetical protein